MKMKKKKYLWIPMILVVIALIAYVKKTPEYEVVNDTLPPVRTGSTAYSISVSLPDDVLEQTFAEDTQLHVYQQADGKYDVVTQVMQDVGVEEVLRELTGQDSQTLTVLKTDRSGLPEYRTSWYTMSEQGGYVHRANVIFDGSVCYCVSYSMPEAHTAELQQNMNSILNSISLDPIEF